MSGFAGKRAVVTGGGRGIGAAISAGLAQAGANVTILGRDSARLHAHASTLKNVKAIPCDITDELAVKNTFAEIGNVDILVNNAGQSHVAPTHKTELGDWERILRINVTAAFLCSREVLPGMLECGSGRIINIASTAGFKGYTRLSAYCASKHALIGFTRALALETATKGITVNAVCPTYTETDMTTEGITAISERLGISQDEALAQLTKQIPQGKMAKPEDIASAVLWLCSPEAATVTGIALPIAGGEVM